MLRGSLLLLVTITAACSSRADGGSAKAKQRLQPLVCADQPLVPTSHVTGNPQARRAAQAGLGFLTSSARTWTENHKCFGCHVQAVTMEALTVGMHHQYDVSTSDVGEMARALELGVTAGGRVTGVAFQAQAWARYDMWIDAAHTDDLLQYTTELIGLQHEDGSIPDDDRRLPITGGTMQTTYQAMQAWRQAFARTADDKWLAPMRKAEQYLSQQASRWDDETVYVQDINFALLGLVAAGVGNAEPSSQRLQKLLLSRQNADGGWALDSTSDALATGQTLYALRLAGRGDGDEPIERGTAWLVKHQVGDGGWHTIKTSQHGADKGEAMWAVLGLVSMDVTSIAVNGIQDGQHVAPSMQLAVQARDNLSGGIHKIELFLDDERIGGACGDKLVHAWNTAKLADGKHAVDVIATNTKGKTSRRRYEVYAGHTYLTQVGTRFDEAKLATTIALRNIALEAGGKVELAVYSADGDKRGARVHHAEQPSTPGAMTFSWNGTGADGKPQLGGKYLAALSYKDASGKVLHETEAMFVHDTEASQHRAWGEIEGNLALDDADAQGASANTMVELVNEKGEVVQRARSTEQGNYRFKSVAEGKYKVRTRKEGFKATEAEVQSTPAAKPAKADFKIKK